MYDANRNIGSTIKRIDGIDEWCGEWVVLRYRHGNQITLTTTNEPMNHAECQRIVNIVANVGVEYQLYRMLVGRN